MSDNRSTLAALAAALSLGLAGCGQKGNLYLPDQTGEVVTRPTQTPPAGGAADTPNTPATPDAPVNRDSPAPEVTPPEGESKDAKDKKNPASQGQPTPR